MLAGTTEQAQDQRVRFQPDAGPAIVTALFTKPAKVVQALEAGQSCIPLPDKRF